MENQVIRILLMDDEPASSIIETAKELFEKKGFEVDVVDTISKAMDEYYEKYHDIFILDIDMSHTNDQKQDDGIHVLKRFISLHNQTKVIMFSAAGQVPEWFEAANTHCYGYIAKDENQASQKLIKMVEEAVKEPRKHVSSMRKSKCPLNLLVYVADNDCLEEIKPLLEDLPGNTWHIEAINDLEKTVTALQSNEKWGVVLLLKNHFSTRSNEKENLKALFATEPFSHTIVCCDGKKEYRPSILYLANLHPFRMINLLTPNWKELLKTGITQAVKWYGRNEIFKADIELLERVKIKLPEDVKDAWENFDEDELNEAYDDLTNSQEEPFR